MVDRNRLHHNIPTKSQDHYELWSQRWEKIHRLLSSSREFSEIFNSEPLNNKVQEWVCGSTAVAMHSLTQRNSHLLALHDKAVLN
jgi:hypothetical protein